MEGNSSSKAPERTPSSQNIQAEWAKALQKILQKLDGTTQFLNEYSKTRRRSEQSMSQLHQLVEDSSANMASEQKERFRRLSTAPVRRRLTALLFQRNMPNVSEKKKDGIPSEKEILRILSHLEDEGMLDEMLRTYRDSKKPKNPDEVLPVKKRKKSASQVKVSRLEQEIHTLNIKLQSKESEIQDLKARQAKGSQFIQQITEQMSREEKINNSVREESKTRVLALRRNIAELEVKLSRAEHDTELAIQEKAKARDEFRKKELEYKDSMRHQVTNFAHRIAILTRTIEDLKRDYDKMSRLKMGGDKEKLENIQKGLNEMKRMARRAVEAEAKVKELTAKMKEHERLSELSSESNSNELESTRKELENERSIVITLCTSTRKTRAEVREKIRKERSLGSGPGDDAESEIQVMKSRMEELDMTCKTQKIELENLTTQLEDAKRCLDGRISRHSTVEVAEKKEEEKEEKEEEIISSNALQQQQQEQILEYEERIEHLTISLALHLGEVKLMRQVMHRLNLVSKKASLAYGGVKASVPRKKAKKELNQLHRQLLRIENLARDDVEFELYQEDIDDYDKLANGVFETARADYETVMSGLRENPTLLDSENEDEVDDIMLPNLSLSLSVRESPTSSMKKERASPLQLSLTTVSDEDDEEEEEEEKEEEEEVEKEKEEKKEDMVSSISSGGEENVNWNMIRKSIESTISENVNESVREYLNVFDVFSSEKAELFCYIIVRKNMDGASSLRLEIEHQGTKRRKDIVKILKTWIVNPDLITVGEDVMSPWNNEDSDENDYENMFFSMPPSVSASLRPDHVAELCDVLQSHLGHNAKVIATLIPLNIQNLWNNQEGTSARIKDSIRIRHIVRDTLERQVRTCFSELFDLSKRKEFHTMCEDFTAPEPRERVLISRSFNVFREAIEFNRYMNRSRLDCKFNISLLFSLSLSLYIYIYTQPKHRYQTNQFFE